MLHRDVAAASLLPARAGVVFRAGPNPHVGATAAAAATAADPYSVGADDPNVVPAPVQAPAPVAVPAPVPVAVPAPAVATPAPTPEPLVCKSISPQADDEWCDGSCSWDQDDGGCKSFCECGPASKMERLAAVPAVRDGQWTPAERARWLERHKVDPAQ